MGIKVAVCSYDRPEACRDQTLACLKKVKWPASDIYVFVANDAEYARYKKVLPRELYGHLVVGKLGLGNQKKFMSRYFPEGEEIVYMHDDVRRIVYRHQVGVKVFDRDVPDFPRYARWAFKVCRQHGLRLWGMRMSANPLFLRPTATIGWLLIGGPVYGEINTRSKSFQARPDGVQEDVERTLQYIHADGNVLRLNLLGLKTRWHGPGGLQSVHSFEARRKIELARGKLLEKKYGKYLKSVTVGRPPHPVDFKFHVSPTRVVIPMPTFT